MDEYENVDYKFLIVCKCISSKEFQKILHLPRILSDITYEYVNFESNKPNARNYFNK